MKRKRKRRKRTVHLQTVTMKARKGKKKKRSGKSSRKRFNTVILTMMGTKVHLPHLSTVTLITNNTAVVHHYLDPNTTTMLFLNTKVKVAAQWAAVVVHLNLCIRANNPQEVMANL